VSKFEITPYVGAGSIKFDNSRESVREILGGFTEFKKSKLSKNTTDNFKFCHVFYNKDNKVEAIEFFAETELLLAGKNLFSMSFNELLQFITTNSFSYKEDDTGAISNELGIAIYAPGKSIIETILVYKKGYYD
jgi:hypothetical protein